MLRTAWAMLGLSALLAIETLAQPAPGAKPLIKDFMGLCVHTVQFKPKLYQPVCSLVRDYHGLNWDLEQDTDFWPVFPLARNQVNWETMYKGWVKEGFRIDASIQLNAVKPAVWKNLTRDANTYGFALARYFGPGNRKAIKAVEIGNEPGDYPDDQYRTVFEAMARGLRAGDPGITIVTCAMIAGPSHQYAKSLDCIKGLEPLYDAINVHSYAQVEGWPTWKRSYPEDPAIPFLKDVQAVIDWRNQQAPGKPVWITEFGWDCTTQPQAKEGTFKDWVGSTDTQQARYLVRAWLLFSAMDLGRAYCYWFNDTDQPQVHGSSGLTRNYQPKPSYFAVSHLYQTLGDYRFSRVIRQQADCYVFEFENGQNGNQRILTLWNPLAGEQTSPLELTIDGMGKITKAERMPMTADPVPADAQYNNGTLKVEIGESPIYLWYDRTATTPAN